MKSKPKSPASHKAYPNRRPRVLGPEFFNRKTLMVAADLIGKYIVRKPNNKKCDDEERRLAKKSAKISARIAEVEAYMGPHDLACHASKGRTARTETLFGKPGTLYVYFVYGMHWMLNVVTEKDGYPAAVLIRGIEVSETDKTGKTVAVKRICGPGRVTKFFGIDKTLNGKNAGKTNGLWFEDRGEKISGRLILKTPRIGVGYAGPIWTKKKFRFVLRK